MNDTAAAPDVADIAPTLPSDDVASGLDISFRPITELIPYARNARTHSDEQIGQIAASIEEFGFTNPILADEKGIVAGHGRCLGAGRLYEAGRTIRTPSGKAIPIGTVPVLDCTGWSEPKRKAYILADNQLALNAGWDFELLKLELDDLKLEGVDVGLIGFSQGELDVILNGWEPDKDKIDAAGENLDGIKSTIKIEVDPVDEDRALGEIKRALTGAEIKFSV